MRCVCVRGRRLAEAIGVLRPSGQRVPRNRPLCFRLLPRGCGVLHLGRDRIVASAKRVGTGTWRWQQVAVDPKVLRHLDLLGIGMERKKTERDRKMRLYRR